MAIYQELKITDGTTVINLLNIDDGYSILGHRQAIAQYKGGGSWSESALGDGGVLASYAYDDVIEAYPLSAIATGDPVATVTALADLLALLRKCSDFWVDEYRNEPGWIIGRACGEPGGNRYAIIKAGLIPDLGNPYEDPWIADAALEGLSLTIRRGHWRDVPPQTGTALPLGVRKYYTGHGPKGNITGATGLLEEVTTNQMYVANTSTEQNLSDIYQYTAIGPVWSANRELTSAFEITGAAINDAMYFGCEDGGADATRKGPDNLVFDINQVANGITYAWEYYSSVGPGWVALAQYADSTDTTPITQGGSFTETGVNSIVFPTSDNWIMCNLFTLFGGLAPNVDCFYLRCRITGAGAAGPTQQNRPVYQCIWPYLEVQDTRVKGQLPQILKAIVYGRSGVETGYPIAGDYKLARVIGGLRSNSRGANFSSRINLGGTQNSAFSDAGPTATAALESYPARLVSTYAPAGVAAFNRRNNVTLALGNNWEGKFRIFVRYNLSTGASGDVNVYLRHTMGVFGDTIQQSETFTAEVGECRMWDFGEFTLPGILPMEDYNNYTQLDLYAECTNAGGAAITFFDMITIPTDEYAFDVSVSRDSHPLRYPEYLEIDSLADPKRIMRTIGIGDSPGTHLKTVWTSIAGSGLQFEPTGGIQQLHLLFADFDNDIEICSPHILTSWNMTAANQYLGMRTE